MESTRPIRALMRGLEALTVLNQRGDASVSEIAQHVRLPRTTVYRILETLCESGFVYRDAADDRYHLTALVRGLSAGFEEEAWLAAVGRPLLRELGEQLRSPLYLALPAGSRLLVREVIEPQSTSTLERLPAGTQLPLLGSAAGRTYLAFCSQMERDALLSALLRSGRDGETPDNARADGQREFDDIRAQGYGISSRSSRLCDEASLCVPVRVHERTLALLTARFHAASLPMRAAVERFLPKLQQCAAKISDQFSAQQAEARRSSAPPTAA